MDGYDQPGLFDQRDTPVPRHFENREPLARAEHEDTSHEAGAALTASGKRDSDKHRVLGWMQVHQERGGVPLTTREIADQSGIPHECVHKRVPDLGRDGFLFKTGKRECRITGRRCVTWGVK